METLCEQLCEEVRPHIGEHGAAQARNIMLSIHNQIVGCNQEQYVWLFMRAAALGMSIESIQHSKYVPTDETWAEFISSKLRIH